MQDSVSIPLAFFEALSSAWTDDDLLRVCATWLPGIIGSDRISLAIIEKDEFVFRAMTEDGEVGPARSVDFQNSTLGQVCRSGRPRIIQPAKTRDLTGGAEFLRRLADSGFHHSMIVPLIAKETLLGSLNASTRNADGFVPGALERANAIGTWIATQLLVRRREREMRDLAMLDPVTGLQNRRGFMAAATEMFEDWRCKSIGQLAVILLDIDHFKRVNDTFGHSAGDAVLSLLADRLREVLPVTIPLGRIGGEEYAAVLPLTARKAGRLADRARDRIAVPSILSGKAVTVTASFGVAAARAGDQVVDDLLNRADEALYRAKAGGRNQVQIAA